ncbi:asparaginase [Konateibacter massiliensis]|uniref:asparaginase n=1 Tax=Konateibacter massiliensis TaxID=2002841 RepID=UPI000C15CE9C|nr:asparaginase [Konateibacter massiliensis]
MKKILLLATGGTIASSDTGEGLSPSIDVEQMMSYVPEMKEHCDLSGISIMSVDSTNMSPKRMAKIAEALKEHYEEYDGFVITHGTDTMGYSAAALSYMLQNVNKPVVVTGSQKAIEEPDTDAVKNLSDALRFACEDVKGVFVAFDGKIINGTHAVKQKTRSADSFESVNFPYVAIIEQEKVTYNSDLDKKNILKNQNEQAGLKIKTDLCEKIFILKIFPGMSPEIFECIQKNYRGVIIESFGIGGIPHEEYDIVFELSKLSDAGVAVVVTTQCMYEGIDLGIYAVGQKLAKQDVICAGDMTTEALTMKLMWALSNCADKEELKRFMETPYFEDRSY